MKCKPSEEITLYFDGETEDEGIERTYTVEYDYTSETPDVPYLRNGDPGYPGDPAEVEIEEVYLGGVKLTPEQLKEEFCYDGVKMTLIDWLYDYVENNFEDFIPEDDCDEDYDREEY